MDSVLEAVLGEYEQREAAEARILQTLSPAEMLHRRDEFLLSVGRNTGMLLNILARESMAGAILELGSSFGYSTLWLADAARATGGRVISIELDSHKAEHARSALDRAGLSDYVEFRVGDALALLGRTGTHFDFVLIDLWKELYAPCFELIRTQLRPGALVVADNMIHPASYQRDTGLYRKRVRKEQNFDSVLLPVGSGLELSRYCAV